MKKVLFFLPGLENTKIKIFTEKNNEFLDEKILIIEKKTPSPQPHPEERGGDENFGKNISENEKIFNFLEKNSVKLENTSKIFFCNGPGRFMSMRISAIIANTFKNQNPKIKLFSIPTAEFLKEKSGGEKIFLQLNNSEIFTLMKNENGDFEEKIYLRGDLEKKFEKTPHFNPLPRGERINSKIFFYGNLKKGLFDFENFENILDIPEKNKKIFSDKEILKKILKNGEKFLTDQIKIFYGK